MIEKYIEKGWTAPLPLPKGEKFPPPLGMTGNIAPIDTDDIRKAWKGRKDWNLGLRLQVAGEYDVIAIDIDHYGDKRGDDHLREVEEQVGPLHREAVPRSTRRGTVNPSGQYFFRVPKGVKWKASACPDVEVVQMTHRYSAVYPSVADGKQYRWYLGHDEIDIPAVDDLPILPDHWVSFLHKDKVGRLNKTMKRNFSGGVKDRYREAYDWLRNNISGWDTPDTMSQSLKKVSDSEEFNDKLQGNGHDSMVAAVHAAVMLGVEGHIGLKTALFKIEKNFKRAVTLRAEKPRTDKQAESEFKEAVIGEVDRLVSDVEEGNVHIVEYGAELALPNFRQMLIGSESDRRPLDVDIQDYSDTDHDNARMVKDHWDKDFMVVDGGDSSQEFAVWVTKTTRYHFQDRRTSFYQLEEGISKRLDYEAKKIQERADALEKIQSERQLREDEDDPDELRDIAEGVAKRSARARQTNTRKAILDALHGFPEVRISIDEFDSLKEIIGLPGGEVLDLSSLRLDGDDFVRRGRQADLLTKSTSVRLVPDARSQAWEDFLDDFLPDKELRDFVQKAIGYSMVSGNPDKKIIFLFGPSNTGKTTILEAVAKALGDYAGPMNAIKLFGASSGGPSPEMVESLNKRMVFMAEVGDDHALSANSVKRVTGNDTQHNRQLHSNVMRSAAPKFTPYVSTNSVPEIRGVDAATKERIMVIPFEEVHPRKEITEESDLKADHNSTAILWWVVEGCKRYYQEGLDPDKWPEKVKQASGVFATDTSPMQSFLEETLVHTDDRSDKVGLQELFGLWESYGVQQRIDRQEIGSVADFRKRVEGNGWKFERGAYSGKRNQYFLRNAQRAE